MTGLRGRNGAPLEGVRVIEFGQIAAGPFAGSLLADLGADVVKVERRDGGDGMRTWPPLVANEAGETYSGNFAALNRNKRSVTADLKDPRDREFVLSLCDKADVVVENFRPAVLARLGLGYATLASRNPTLVYCSISGYGQTGPMAQRGAFDLTVQAASGIMSCTGERDGSPVKVGVPVGDFCAGLYAAYATLAVLRRGRGGYIDCSMFGALLGISALQTSEYFGTGVPAKPLGTAHPRNAPYQSFRGSDGPFAVAAGNDRLWTTLCRVLQVPDLATDARFATVSLRAQHQAELAAILSPIFARRPAQEWVALLDGEGVPCAPINDFASAVSDEQSQALGLVSEVELGNGVPLSAVGFPVGISEFEYATYRRPPRLGEHNEEVLRDWTLGQNGAKGATGTTESLAPGGPDGIAGPNVHSSTRAPNAAEPS
jgi:succinate---hydroxymethylglutarate CoA-transferase